VTIEREKGIAYSIRYGTAPLEEVAMRTKPMPDEFIAADGNDVTPAFVEYLRPLVGGLEPYSSFQEIPAGESR